MENDQNKGILNKENITLAIAVIGLLLSVINTARPYFTKAPIEIEIVESRTIGPAPGASFIIKLDCIVKNSGEVDGFINSIELQARTKTLRYVAIPKVFILKDHEVVKEVRVPSHSSTCFSILATLDYGHYRREVCDDYNLTIYYEYFNGRSTKLGSVGPPTGIKFRLEWHYPSSGSIVHQQGQRKVFFDVSKPYRILSISQVLNQDTASPFSLETDYFNIEDLENLSLRNIGTNTIYIEAVNWDLYDGTSGELIEYGQIEMDRFRPLDVLGTLRLNLTLPLDIMKTEFEYRNSVWLLIWIRYLEMGRYKTVEIVIRQSVRI